MSTKARYLEFTPEWIDWFWEQHTGYPDPDACWLWTGSKHTAGYGLVNLPVVGGGTMTHRLAYWLTYGEDLTGRIVCHRCPTQETKTCDNPKHLYNGTHKENTADRIAYGNRPIPPHMQGEAHGMAKRTQAEVDAIRAEYTGARGEQRRLAKKWNMTQGGIQAILTGKSWKLPGEDRERRLREGMAPAAKLTREQAMWALAEYKRRGGKYGTIAALARELNVSPSAMKKLIHGLTWPDLPR